MPSAMIIQLKKAIISTINKLVSWVVWWRIKKHHQSPATRAQYVFFFGWLHVLTRAKIHGYNVSAVGSVGSLAADGRDPSFSKAPTDVATASPTTIPLASKCCHYNLVGWTHLSLSTYFWSDPYRWITCLMRLMGASWPHAGGGALRPRRRGSRPAPLVPSPVYIKLVVIFGHAYDGICGRCLGISEFFF